MEKRLLRLLGGAGRVKAGRLELRLIPAAALLRARYEAQELAKEKPETEGLCLNACILAQAAYTPEGRRAFEGGAAVLEQLPAETITRLAERYLKLCREEDAPEAQERRALREALEKAPYERLKWRVLRTFGVLSSERRAREMTRGDYLYCVMNLALDDEQAMRQLCPQCREEAERSVCVCCGAPLPEENPGFDEERFEELKRNGVCG